MFTRISAIVTDVGANLSHASIVARELGIPAVVGCGDATTRIRTGQRIRLDGGTGRWRSWPRPDRRGEWPSAAPALAPTTLAFQRPLGQGKRNFDRARRGSYLHLVFGDRPRSQGSSVRLSRPRGMSGSRPPLPRPVRKPPNRVHTRHPPPGRDACPISRCTHSAS
ncbi:PEP-utilizing enzyme [Streptomyces sp. NPDC054787]